MQLTTSSHPLFRSPLDKPRGFRKFPHIVFRSSMGDRRLSTPANHSASSRSAQPSPHRPPTAQAQPPAPPPKPPPPFSPPPQMPAPNSLPPKHNPARAAAPSETPRSPPATA